MLVQTLNSETKKGSSLFSFIKWKKSRTFDFYAKELLELKKTKAKATQEQAYFILTKHLIPYFGAMALTSITSYDVEKYLGEKVATGLRVFHHIKFFRMTINQAKKMGHDAPAISIACPDPKQRRGKLYTKGELVRLVHEARINKNLRLQVVMGYQTGMRRSEICHFKFSFFDPLSDTICLPGEYIKTGAPNRTFQITPMLARILRARIRRASPGQTLLFPSKRLEGSPIVRNYSEWNRLRVRSDVLGRFHDLRCTWVSRQLQAGVSGEFIAQAGGLDESTIKIYAYVPPAVRALMTQAYRVA